MVRFRTGYGEVWPQPEQYSSTGDSRGNFREMPIDLLPWYVLLLPFLPPLLAGSSRTLWKFAVPAFLPAVALLGLMLLPDGAGAFTAFLGCFIAACLGTLARRMSLLVRATGHVRPASLWIEMAFLVLAVAFVRAAGL